MNAFKQLVVASLIATAGMIALPGTALAGQEYGSQSSFVHGPDYYSYQMEKYNEQIARMSQEDRAKLMAMQDKLMQMEMDHASSEMKMEMDTAKAKRDIEMFIVSASGRGQR